MSFASLAGGPPRPPRAGWGHALTLSFADSAAGVCGTGELRLEQAVDAPAPAIGALSVLIADGEVISAESATSLPAPSAEGESPVEWGALAGAGFSVRPGSRPNLWSARWESAGESTCALEFEPWGEAIVLGADSPPVRAGGAAGVEQLCRVTGEARWGRRPRRIDGLGQLGQRWGSPLALGRSATASSVGPAEGEKTPGALRSLGLWFDSEHAVLLSSAGPAAAGPPGVEQIAGFVLDGTPPMAQQMAESRLSSTFDAHGKLLRAGIELWPDHEEGFPRRAAGELVAAVELDVTGAVVQVAFLRWWMEGRTGLGRYEVARPR